MGLAPRLRTGTPTASLLVAAAVLDLCSSSRVLAVLPRSSSERSPLGSPLRPQLGPSSAHALEEEVVPTLSRRPWLRLAVGLGRLSPPTCSQTLLEFALVTLRAVVATIVCSRFVSTRRA